MSDRAWLEALGHELAARGLTPADRAEALVEVESHLAESGLAAADQFGPAARYAEALAAAAGLDPDRSRRRSTTGPGLVEAAAVSRTYRGRRALEPVTLRVGPGDIVAVTGPNGSGKSTLLRLLAGLERPDTGRVTRSASVGYVPQHGGLHPRLRPTEHVVLLGSARGLTRPAARREGERLARELGWDLAAAPVAGDLSGGTAQKLSVILALIGSPGLLLLDEPYQGLDAAGTRQFWELLWARCDQGTAAVVSSHDPEVLRRATTVIELGSGGAGQPGGAPVAS